MVEMWMSTYIILILDVNGYARLTVICFLTLQARIKSKSHYVTSYPRMSQPLKPEAQAVQQVPQTPTGQQPDLHASQPQPVGMSFA